MNKGVQFLMKKNQVDVFMGKATLKGNGVVTVETKGLNQRGEEVCFFRRKVMVWKRDHAPRRRRPIADSCESTALRPLSIRSRNGCRCYG